MKYNFVLLIVLFPVLASAQRVPNIDSLVNNVLEELKASWTLGVDSNSNTVDIGMYNKYKKLFDFLIFLSAVKEQRLCEIFGTIPIFGHDQFLLNEQFQTEAVNRLDKEAKACDKAKKQKSFEVSKVEIMISSDIDVSKIIRTVMI